MEALEPSHEQPSCNEETLDFISDLVELVSHYEDVIDNLQSKSNTVEAEAQDLRLKLTEAVSNAQIAENMVAETIFMAITPILENLSLSGEKCIDLDVPNHGISPSIYKMIIDNVSTYKTQLAENAKAMQQKVDSAALKSEDLEQHMIELSTTIRTLGNELLSLMPHTSSQESGLSSSIANLTFSMDNGATLSTVLADFTSVVQTVSEHTAQMSAKLLQAESELLFYKAQASTRADSEQKALANLSIQSAENDKLKKENSNAFNLVSDLQMGLYAKNSEIAEMQKELRSVVDSLKVEETKTAYLNKELLATQKMLAEAQSNLLLEQSKVSSLSNVQLQLEKALEDLHAADMTIAKLKTEHQDMETAMTTQTDTIKQLNMTLNDVLKDKSRLDAKLQEDITTRQGVTQELYEKIDELSSQNSKLKTRISEVEHELVNATKQSEEVLRDTEHRAEKIMLENREISNRILQLEETERILTENLKECEMELARVQEANIALQTDIVEISQEKEQMKEQSSANEGLMNDRIEQTEQTMLAMTVEMNDLKQQVENLTTDIRVREEMIANCEEEIGRLDALNTETTEKLQRLIHQKKDLEDELVKKDLQVEKANTSLVNATSDMQIALKSAEDAFTNRYLKALEDLKVARAGSVELEERLVNLRSELQSAHLRLDEKEAEMEALQFQNEVFISDKESIIDKLQASLTRQGDSIEALSLQNDSLTANIQELNTRIRVLENELALKTGELIGKNEHLHALLTNGSDTQNTQISEQAKLLLQQDAKIGALKSDFSNIEHRLSELVDTASGILDLLVELAEDSNQSMVELSKVGSRSVSRGASVAESLALSTFSTARSMGLSRILVETTAQQKESEAALAVERIVRLEAAVASIRESILTIITLTKQRLDEVSVLQERISVKEKEVNLLLDLTKSREDRINVLLEEINSKGVTISEQSEVIDKMMKDLQALKGAL